MAPSLLLHGTGALVACCLLAAVAVRLALGLLFQGARRRGQAARGGVKTMIVLGSGAAGGRRRRRRAHAATFPHPTSSLCPVLCALSVQFWKPAIALPAG